MWAGSAGKKGNLEFICSQAAGTPDPPGRSEVGRTSPPQQKR